MEAFHLLERFLIINFLKILRDVNELVAWQVLTGQSHPFQTCVPFGRSPKVTGSDSTNLGQ